jgi:hypothetical protein
VKYDVTDPQIAPDGFLVRANFSFSADTSCANTWRYLRATEKIAEAAAAGGADVAAILRIARDLATRAVDPYPLPYEGAPPLDPGAIGFVETANTINRSSTASFGVIRGVLPGEDPLLSTFYAGLGQPVVGIVLPFWVGAGPTPEFVDGELGSPFCNIALERTNTCYNHHLFRTWLNTFFLVHSDGLDGYLVRVEEIESWLIPEVEMQLQDWYENGFRDSIATIVEHELAELAYAEYQAPVSPPTDVDESWMQIPRALTCWPNPMRDATLLRIDGRAAAAVGTTIEICDVTGRIVRRLRGVGGARRHDPASPGAIDHLIRWDGRDRQGRPVAPGVYFLRLPNARGVENGSVIVAR